MSFDWVKALRYYWHDDRDTCLVCMSNSEYPYGYEYLGAQKRLVITPLTDRCYLCLMGALQLDLGINEFFSVENYINNDFLKISDIMFRNNFKININNGKKLLGRWSSCRTGGYRKDGNDKGFGQSSCCSMCRI